MRDSIAAVVAVIAIAVPLAGCGGGGAVSGLGEDGGKAASGAAKAGRHAWEDSHEFRQLRKSACSRAKSREWSETLQGKDSDDAPGC
jgi:predicted small secreted protein